MIKKIIIFFTSVYLIILFSIMVNADILSAYANTDPESNIVSLLVSAMKSDVNYDPFNEYVVIRTSESQYKVAFGADLDQGATVYTYIQQSMGTPASITRSTASSISVNTNGYYITGNIQGALSSSKAETFKFQSVIVVVGICLVIFFLLRIFRRTHTVKSSYYNVR